MPPDNDAANPVPIHWFPDRPVTIYGGNRWIFLARSALGAPERFSSCSRLSGVQMLNAELELAARTG